MLNLLAIFPKRLWETKMSPARRHAIWALQRRSDVTCGLSGPDWKDWNNQADLAENVAAVQPDAHAILWYKPLGHRIAAAVKNPNGCKLLKVETYNEAWWPNHLAAKESLQAGTGLIVCHHASDVQRFELAAASGVKIVHIPHGAEDSVFSDYAKPWSERGMDVLITGCQSKECYPLRHKWREAALSGFFNGRVCVWPHPGYWMKNVSECERNVIKYAEILGQTKIALVCGSVYRYPLAKYPEAAMAGALPVGDEPREAPDGYSRMVHYVDSGASVAELANAVNALLADDAGLKAKAEQAHAIALERFTMDVYADSLVKVILEALP